MKAAQAVHIRSAAPEDAGPVSRLIRSLSGPFLTSPSGEGAEPFFASISEASIAGYITATNIDYRVAESATGLAALVALRDNKHLFHLFVATAHQGQGLARRLWGLVRDAALAAGNPGEFTVNASLNAVPVYIRYGFMPTAEVQHVHGISYVPMVLRGQARPHPHPHPHPAAVQTP